MSPSVETAQERPPLGTRGALSTFFHRALVLLTDMTGLAHRKRRTYYT